MTAIAVGATAGDTSGKTATAKRIPKGNNFSHGMVVMVEKAKEPTNSPERERAQKVEKVTHRKVRPRRAQWEPSS